MLNRTHLAISALSIIIFLGHVIDKWIFVGVMVFSTLLPNIDNFVFGKKKRIFLEPFKMVLQRDLIHSFTFCILITTVLAFYWPVFAFPFFLGYALHLLADSWTVNGIRPFWPLKARSKGRVQTGGALEETIFMIFIILDIVFLFVYFI